jgi:hypothetical protein
VKAHWNVWRRGGLLPIALVLAASGLTVERADAERRSSVSVTINQLEVDFTVMTPEISAAAKLVVVVVMKNKSAGNLRLNALFLDRPKVLLKVRDSEGLPVHPGSPGMPPLDDGETGRKELKPEESVAYKYVGKNYFGADLLPGKYQIQFRYENTLPQKGDWTGTIETEWLDFEVMKPSLRGRK